MRSQGVVSTMILTAGAIALGGCSSGPPRQTTADLARAHTLVASAQGSGAQQYAAAELQSARDKAQQADRLADHDAQQADRLANEAAVDAQLASARAQNAKAQKALDDLHRSLQTLRNETQSEESAPAGTQSPSPHENGGESAPRGASPDALPQSTNPSPGAAPHPDGPGGAAGPTE